MPFREKLHYASMIAELDFSNTRTAIAHSIAYPLTGQLGMPHGIACSFTLPEIMKVNGEGNRERVDPIMRAVGCSSLTGAVSIVYDFLIEAGVPKIGRQFFRSEAE